MSFLLHYSKIWKKRLNMLTWREKEENTKILTSLTFSNNINYIKSTLQGKILFLTWKSNLGEFPIQFKTKGNVISFRDYIYVSFNFIVVHIVPQNFTNAVFYLSVRLYWMGGHRPHITCSICEQPLNSSLHLQWNGLNGVGCFLT